MKKEIQNMTHPKPQTPAFRISTEQTFPEVVVYTDRNFEGESWRTNLSYSHLGDHWSDMISSIIVISGTWEFWSDIDFTGGYCKLGPGYYPSFRGECSPTGFLNKGISSFRCVSQNHVAMSTT
jgi:hypothetical protein